MAENTTATNTLQYVGQVKVTKLKKGKKVHTTKTKNSGTLLLSQLLTYMLVRANKLAAMPSFIDLGYGDPTISGNQDNAFQSGLFARAPITGWQYKTDDDNKPYAYFRALIPGKLIKDSADRGSYDVLLLCNTSSAATDNNDYGTLAYAKLTGDDPISTEDNKDVSYLIEWTMRVEFESPATQPQAQN